MRTKKLLKNILFFCICLYLTLQWSQINVMAEEKNMETLKLNWDLEPDKLVTYKNKQIEKGVIKESVKIENYKIVDSNTDGYKELTFEVIYYRDMEYSAEEVDKMLSSEHFKKYGNFGDDSYWAIIDYNSGKCLETKNDKNVTVTYEVKRDENDKVKFYSERGYVSYYKKSINSIKIVFPEDYNGLCIGVGGSDNLYTNEEQNADFWNGEASFWDSDYYVPNDTGYSHFMRVDATIPSKYFNGHRYEYFEGGISWYEAKEKCEELGGHLVVISSKEEQEFINSYVEDLRKKGTLTKQDIWIGASIEDGDLKWVADEDSDYTNWADGEPNNVYSMQDCVMMYTPLSVNGELGFWNDESGEGRNWEGYTLNDIGYICEWPKGIEASENDTSIVVFTTEPSFNVKTGESMWLAFGLIENGVLDENWKKMAVTVSDPTVLGVSDYIKIEEGYSLEVKGKKEGFTYVTITDTDSGTSMVLLVNVYDSYVRTYSYDIKNIESFYPENKWENDIATNIYDINGIYVNNYKCTKNGNKYQVSFHAYNSKYHTGAVDIYDADGKWIGSEGIEKKTSITNFYGTVEQAIFLVHDVATGKMLSYEQGSFSKYTPISIEVPEGGYFTISNNFSKSPGTFLYNTSEILLSSAMEFIKDAPDISIEPSKFFEMLKGEIFKDPNIRDAWMEIFEDFVASEMENIGQKLLSGEVNHAYSNLLTGFENILNALKIDWKGLVASATGVGESAFSKFSGPAGVGLEFCFSFAKQTDRILQATMIATSIDEPYVTVYSEIEEGEIAPNGVVVHTNGNMDAEAVLQVFKVSDSDIIEVVLDGGDSLQKYEIYNISFVKDDKTVQPYGKVEVYIPIPEGMNGRSCNVYRQEEDGSWVILKAYIQGDYLVFETDHFSMYAIIGNMEKLTVASLPNKVNYIENEVLDTNGLTLDLNGKIITNGYLCNPTVLAGNGIQKIKVKYGCAETEFEVNVSPNTSIPSDANGWYTIDGKDYWYENGIRQGMEGRGKEIYDPQSDAWYWLDAVQDGAKAVDKDVYQESSGGKWVRYDVEGRMIKGEDYRYNGWYYFEPITGTMMKGAVTLPEGRKVFYDTVTGQMLKGEHYINGQIYVFDEIDGHLISGDDDCIWCEVDGKKYWYENWQRQGWNPENEAYRGKEIYDPQSDAWYWLDNVQQGAMAVSKDVYQESLAGEWGDYVGADGERYGKWVRYDENGHMVKGWSTNENGTYYFDPVYGTMAKGEAVIDGQNYYFDMNTGILQ